MWFIWIILLLVFIKLYTRFSSGRCYTDTVMIGKVVIVTGANCGIGYETAIELARRGAKVILACRNERRALRAVERIKRKTGNTLVRYMHLDLSSFATIRKFVEEFQKSEAKLDVLINNAGTSGTDTSTTEDGIIRDMQVNHFGPFLLTVLLVPMLKKSAPSRVVIVSSLLHKIGSINNITDKASFGYIRAYSNAKLCNVLFSKELARRLEGTGVDVNCLHPGFVNTSLFKNCILDKLRNLVLYTFFKSPQEGAQTSIYLAVSDECYQVSGKYFSDCEESRESSKAQNIESAMKLWSISEKLVKLKPEERV